MSLLRYQHRSVRKVFTWIFTSAKWAMSSRWCHRILLRKSMLPMSGRLSPGQPKMRLCTINRSCLSIFPANKKSALSQLGPRTLHGMLARDLPLDPQHLRASWPTLLNLRLLPISLQHLHQGSQPAQRKMLQIPMIFIYCTSIDAYHSNE